MQRENEHVVGNDEAGHLATLHVPGSLSSAFTTRKEGRPSDFLGMNDHFRPDGKPAPPRPRSPDFFISSMIASGPVHSKSRVRCQAPRFSALGSRQSCSPYRLRKMRSWSLRPPYTRVK